MQAWLRVENSNANLKRIALLGETLIGRSSECKLKIASNLVSRKHCRLFVQDNGVFIQDLGSANGTLVDGKPLARRRTVELPHGSLIQIGPATFRLEVGTQDATVAPVPSTEPIAPTAPPAVSTTAAPAPVAAPPSAPATVAPAATVGTASAALTASASASTAADPAPGGATSGFAEPLPEFDDDNPFDFSGGPAPAPQQFAPAAMEPVAEEEPSSDVIPTEGPDFLAVAAAEPPPFEDDPLAETGHAAVAPSDDDNPFSWLTEESSSEQTQRNPLPAENAFRDFLSEQ